MARKQSKIVNQKNKGITLIALVVTIVVLIILAAVSINMLIGENGIISQAAMAKDEQRGASVEELVGMWKSEKEMVKLSGIGSVKSRDDLLDNELGPNGSQKLMTQQEVEEVKETGKVQIGSKLIDFGVNSRTLVELYDAGELKIGDYVNYQNPSSGNYIISEDESFSVDKNMHWRVLGKDKETGGIKLIAGSPIKKDQVEITNNPYFSLLGREDYNDAETKLNSIASIYKNSDLADNARSVTLEDINEVVGVTIAEDGTPNVNESETYGQTFSYTNQYASPEDYDKGIKSNFTKTDTSYTYMLSNPSLTTSKDSRLYHLILEDEEENGNKEYWLATPSISAYTGRVCFGIYCVTSYGVHAFNTFYSDGYSDGTKYAVRPVVLLKSTITEEQIQKIEDQIEESWKYYRK